MDYSYYIQQSLDNIDRRIKDDVTIQQLADDAGFSIPHFSRMFRQMIGMPVYKYICRRKLQYSLYDIMQGQKIIDAAIAYGFDTASGYTKAFKKEFGITPALYRIHGHPVKPEKIEVGKRLNTGGVMMEPRIIEMEEKRITGVEFKNDIKGKKHTADIPAFWLERGLGDGDTEILLYDTFRGIPHGEYCLCIPADSQEGEFFYFLGVRTEGVTDVPEGMKQIVLPWSLYAVFTTPKVPVEKFVDSIKDTWSEILNKWLPNSNYEFDQARFDYEFYDERCHEDVNKELCAEICIPVKEKQLTKK